MAKSACIVESAMAVVYQDTMLGEIGRERKKESSVRGSPWLAGLTGLPFVGCSSLLRRMLDVDLGAPLVV